LQLSNKYPDYLFYFTTDLYNDPQKTNLGIIRNQSYIYIKFKNEDEKKEVHYAIKNNKDSYYTHENLKLLFNHGVSDKCLK